MPKKPETLEEVIERVCRMDEVNAQAAVELNHQNARLESIEDVLTKATKREVSPMAQRFEDFFKNPPRRTGVTDKAPTVQSLINRAMRFAERLSSRKRKLNEDDFKV